MTQQVEHFLSRLARMANWPSCGLLLLGLTLSARATDSLYEVDFPVVYDIPPVIDASNFVNYATSFEIDSTTPLLYETWNTVNYTNYGTMEDITGFQFDLQVTNAFGNTQHLMAGNFYNAGSILCDSASGISVVVSSGSSGGVSTVLLPQCIINASNVINNNGGLLDVGGTGLIQVSGQNIDLSDGFLNVDNNGLGSIQAIPESSDGVVYAGFGIDTNLDWDPSVDLSAGTAAPSEVQVGAFNPPTWVNPLTEAGFNSPLASTPYLAVTQLATNSFIYRSVFLENFVSSVSNNVYINGSYPNLPGSGEAVVEFVGTYVNPATKVPSTQYFYVRDDYLLGSTNTSINKSNGLPNSLTFTNSTVSLVSGNTAQSAGVFQAFPAGIITNNNYAYADVECTPTTVPLNNVSPEESNYLSTLTGSVKINATNNLNLTGVQITGVNYVSISASNELVGSAGAAISAPYSDINVAATNVNLMATNTLEPTTAAWDGVVSAWSTRWLYVATNTTFVTNVVDNTNSITTNSFSITNDYRVLIVGADIAPGTPSYVWNLSLRDTNNVYISDDYNILNNFYVGGLSLTLTANSPGAASPFGELDLLNTTVNWPTAAPNLRYLTNNGYIFLPNQGVFGSRASSYGALINSGEIYDLGSQVWSTNFSNTGEFLNNTGPFSLVSQNATFMGGVLNAQADVSITASNLNTYGLQLVADRSLTLNVSNNLTDGGVTNGGVWKVGDASVGSGLKLPLTVANGDLRGTTIYDYAPASRTVVNVWSAADEGPINQGYTNNVAIGQLILNAEGQSPFTQLYFTGAGTSNAIYVDHLDLEGFASYSNHSFSNTIPTLGFNTNLVIYYADATASGVGDVSFLLNGFNGNHLRWVPTYVGYFSSTNVVYPNGSTNALNTGLANSPFLDSNANGTPNSSDPAPFLVPSQLAFADYKTNNPLNAIAISWYTVPLATNYVYYSTNVNMANEQLLTNLYLTNNPFVTPEAAPGPLTNITVFDPVVSTNATRFYQVLVNPDILNP